MQQKIIRHICLMMALLLMATSSLFAKGADTMSVLASAPHRKGLIHRIGAQYRPEYNAKTNPFLKGDNGWGRPMDFTQSAHLRYSFEFQPESRAGKIYGGVYQGIGAAFYALGNTTELGDPIAIYLLQGARIARLSDRLSLNYEWNFGISFGWQPYHSNINPRNIMIGSKMNAYLNVDFYLDRKSVV